MGLGTPGENSAHRAQDLLIDLQPRSLAVLDGIRTLLEGGTIEDPADQRIIEEAAIFIESPAENLPDTISHTTRVGQVAGGYDQQGLDIPPAIDAMHAYLLSLQCISRMNFVEEELEKGSPDLPAIQQTMIMALQDAEILSTGYKDGTLLVAVKELQARLDGV